MSTRSGRMSWCSARYSVMTKMFSLSSCAAAGRASGMRMGMDAPYESVAAMVQRPAPSARVHRPETPPVVQITPKVEIKACPKNLRRFSLAKWQLDATMVRREKLGRKDTYMYQTRKIGVVGQGHVGAHVANSLLMQGIADELYLCDINEAKVTSEVQDLRDSLSFVPYNTKIVNCYDHYEELACCDVIVTPPQGRAGRRQPRRRAVLYHRCRPHLCQAHRRRRL